MSEFWFVVALIEFVLLVVTYAPGLLARRAAHSKEKEQNSEPKGGKTGKIHNLQWLVKGIGKNPVTVFEIHGEDGSIFYAGIDGHGTGLSDGDRIQYWRAWDSIALSREPRLQTNKDGTTSPGLEERRYMALKRYRILPEEEISPEEGYPEQVEETA